MAENNAYISDADDSTSNITVESDESNTKHSVVQTHCENNINVNASINSGNVSIVDVLDRASSHPHITSVTLQNSHDITFGNKMLYNGPITVNQYGGETTFTTTKLEKKTSPMWKRWKSLVTVVAVVFTLISLGGILQTILSRNKEADITDIDNDNTPLKLVSREQWRASPPSGDIEDLNAPVPLVIVQHTVQSSCDTLDTCALLVRQAQQQHINSRDIQDDIGYNFLIGGDGAAYVGRGWDKLGAHTRGYNRRSIGVAFIGDYREEPPTNQQIVNFLKLLREGVNLGKLSENYTLIGANQVQQTESPGKLLFKALTKLPHWSDQFD